MQDNKNVRKKQNACFGELEAWKSRTYGNGSEYNFYVLLPYITYVMQSGRFFVKLEFSRGFLYKLN